MSAIQDLLEADHANTANSVDALQQFSPDLPGALDCAADLIDQFIRHVAAALDDSEELRAGSAITDELGVEPEQLRELLNDEKPAVGKIEEARTIWRRLYTRQARRVLLLLLQRHFMWAATDLLRMRLTPVLGYCRQEAEAIALLVLVRDRPDLGIRWLHVRTDEEGVTFFREMQHGVRSTLKRLKLNDAYERGSGAALHVRFASAVLGLSFDRQPNEIWLGFQEVRPNESFQYYLDALGFLSVQVRVVRALGEAFPEVTDPSWLRAVNHFTRKVAALWEELSRQFPAECRRLEEMESPRNS